MQFKSILDEDDITKDAICERCGFKKTDHIIVNTRITNSDHSYLVCPIRFLNGKPVATCLSERCNHEPEATDEIYCWCCTNIDLKTNTASCLECGSMETKLVHNPHGSTPIWECQKCGDRQHPGCPTMTIVR